MGVRDAAEALGLTPRQVYEAIDRGELKASNAGEGIRIARADVAAYQAGH